MVIALCPFGDASDAACFTSVFSPFFLVCRVYLLSACHQLGGAGGSWAWLHCEARTGPAVAAEGHRDACFTAAPTPASAPREP